MANPVEALLALAGRAMLALTIFAAIIIYVFGHKPKPCPRHICFPQNEVVTVEQMIRENPTRFGR